MKMAWMLGWAVPTTGFAVEARKHFPTAHHTFFAATPEAIDRLAVAGPWDVITGYSLGTHLILREAGRVAALAPRVGLLAPIFGFTQDLGLGGRIARPQVRALSRWVRRDRPAALVDFYTQAGLSFTAEGAAGLALEDLLWGLTVLETSGVEPVLPAGWQAWVGERDTLFDAAILAEQCPTVTVLKDASHRPDELLAAWAQALAGSDAVTENFSQAAPTYTHHAAVQAAMAAWLAEWLPAKTNGEALEVGAGTGLFTARLLPWRGRLLATDAAAGMCTVGRAALPEVEWRPMRAEAPEPGPWDWIFSSCMLQWVYSPEAVFRRWRDVLAPGGRILTGLFCEGSLPELRAATGWSPLAWRAPEDWAACIEGAGLRILRMDTVRRVFYHPSAHDVLRRLHAVGAAPECRFSAGRLRQAIRSYDRGHRTDQGVPATWMFLRVEAVTAG